MKLAFVAALAVALGVGATLGGAHLSAGTLQATLSAASESGECSPCEDCAKPVRRLDHVWDRLHLIGPDLQPSGHSL